MTSSELIIEKKRLTEAIYRNSALLPAINPVVSGREIASINFTLQQNLTGKPMVLEIYKSDGANVKVEFDGTKIIDAFYSAMQSIYEACEGFAEQDIADYNQVIDDLKAALDAEKIVVE